MKRMMDAEDFDTCLEADLKCATFKCAPLWLQKKRQEFLVGIILPGGAVFV